jgi:hypothetical protein
MGRMSVGAQAILTETVETVDESWGRPTLSVLRPVPSTGSTRRQQQPVAIIRIARLWPGAARGSASSPAIVHADPTTDSLEAFGSEAATPPPAPILASIPPKLALAEPSPAPRPRARQGVLRWAAAIVVSAAAASAGVWGYQRTSPPVAPGTLTIQTSPSGLPVGIDGRSVGLTPVTLTLAPATYAVQIGSGDRRRDLSVNVAAGSAVLQHLELPAAVAAEAPTEGSLVVQTEPTGQLVEVDGSPRGQSPLTIAALAAGDHSVVVRSPRGALRRTVTVRPGEAVSLVISPVESAAPSPGWLSVQAAARLELREAGKLIGTTETEQLMLAAGAHDIEIVNDGIGYRSTRQVTVVPGKVTTLEVELPYGSLNLNAQPWAEVWIDGERVGETPIANLQRRIGSHEVVFRHPELGERKETILVTLRQPVRIGVDMRGK